MGKREGGSSAAEAVIAFPVFMVVLLFAVQMALWAHAASLVQAAAGEGDQIARAAGGSLPAGEHQADSVLSTLGAQVVMDPSVTVRAISGGMVEVRVSGTAEAVLPWVRLPVAATRIGPEQEFRVSG
ncbi:MAG: TadE/TadG family type IV pilus assembly protein [Acidimicrobiales bacterium]